MGKTQAHKCASECRWKRSVAWAEPQSAGTTCNIQPLLWKSPHRGQDPHETHSCVWFLAVVFLGLDTFNKPLAVIDMNACVMWIATDTRAAALAKRNCPQHLLLDVIHQVLQIQVIPVVHDGLLHKLSQSIPSLREKERERAKHVRVYQQHKNLNMSFANSQKKKKSNLLNFNNFIKKIQLPEVNSSTDVSITRLLRCSVTWWSLWGFVAELITCTASIAENCRGSFFVCGASFWKDAVEILTRLNMDRVGDNLKSAVKNQLLRAIRHVFMLDQVAFFWLSQCCNLHAHYLYACCSAALQMYFLIKKKKGRPQTHVRHKWAFRLRFAALVSALNILCSCTCSCENEYK